MEKKEKNFSLKVVLHLPPWSPDDKSDHILGVVSLTEKETFTTVLRKINQVLRRNRLVAIQDFHYQTEDGDIDYVNSKNGQLSSFLESIAELNRVYVYFDDSV